MKNKVWYLRFYNQTSTNQAVTPCELLEDKVKCTTSHPIYQITCKICREKYCGESSRTLHERLSEHLVMLHNLTKLATRNKLQPHTTVNVTLECLLPLVLNSYILNLTQ